MKTKLIDNKYFSDHVFTNNSSSLSYTSYMYYSDHKKRDPNYCIKMGIENKLPLHVITLITRLSTQDEYLWPSTMRLELSKGRKEKHNYCIFTLTDLDMAIEICRFLDIVGTGLINFESDKYNFPIQYKETDSTLYYDMSEEKHLDHTRDRKIFSATVGTYKLLRLVDAILGASYTTERIEDETYENLYATHSLYLGLVEVYDDDNASGTLCYECTFDVKSDALKDKLISILEK